MIQKLTIFLILCTTLVACGGKSGKKEETAASFQIFVGAVSDPNLTGGVMVYGREAGGETFAINVTSDTLSFPIPNGQWNFYAFGWSGPNSLEGTLRCGEATATLGGGDAVVSFTLNSPNCNNGNYGAPAYLTGDQVRPLRLVHCTDISGVVDGTSDCNGFLSGTKSYRIEMTTFGAVASPPLQALCINEAVAASGITDTNLKIPTGGFFTDFLSARISTFKNVNCAGSATKVFEMPAGLEAAATGHVSHPGASHTVVFLDAPPLIIIPGIALSPAAAASSQSATSYVMYSTTGSAIKTEQLTSTSYKFRQNRKAASDKLRYSESTNFILNTGNR